MNRLRWYSSATMLPNAEVYVQGGTGGADFPERRTSNGTFQLLTGASTSNLSSGYPKNFVGPDGLVFGDRQQRDVPGQPGRERVDHACSGRSRPTTPAGTATSVMFAPGRILQVGGGNANAASRNASIIDINGGSPAGHRAAAAAVRPPLGQRTVMADGRVLVSGGSAVNNAATGVAYTTEIFNPATNSWSTGATATRMRLYHSASLLLPDATVITMGGGTPGPETNLNAEIYYPPYLFNGDGTAGHRGRRSRPRRPSPIPADDAQHRRPRTPPRSARVSLVKIGSVTHSDDMDQRFLDLHFTRSGDTLHGDAADQRQPDAARPLHDLRARRGRRAVGGQDRADQRRRHDAASAPRPRRRTRPRRRARPPRRPADHVDLDVDDLDHLDATSTSTSTSTRRPPRRARRPVNLVQRWLRDQLAGERNARRRRRPDRVDEPVGWVRGVARRHRQARRRRDVDDRDRRAGRGNGVEQTVATEAGRTYTLSFLQSPDSRRGHERQQVHRAVEWRHLGTGPATARASPPRHGSPPPSPWWRPETTGSRSARRTTTASAPSSTTSRPGALTAHRRSAGDVMPLRSDVSRIDRTRKGATG